jgi:hypothetical protein
VDGVSAYWIRLKVSVELDSSVDMDEMDVVLIAPISSGYHYVHMIRTGVNLNLYVDGILWNSVLFPDSIANNSNSLIINEYGTVRWCDLAYVEIAGKECFNALQRDYIASAATVYNSSRATGIATTANATTIIDATLSQSLTDFWKDCTVVFTSGAAINQNSIITAFDPGTDTITFGTIFPVPSNGDSYYISGRSLTGLFTPVKVFEMWAEGMDIPDNYSGPGGTIVTIGPGNLEEHFTDPGLIPNLFVTGDGSDIPQSSMMVGGVPVPWTPGGPTPRALPFHYELIVPAAAALGVSTQWLWMMIMATLSICCALLVFTWINSTWFTVATLCFCLFAFSFTGIFPAWIALVTAIIGLASLFFAVRTIG